jgi:hypothetical protein
MAVVVVVAIPRPLRRLMVVLLQAAVALPRLSPLRLARHRSP